MFWRPYIKFSKFRNLWKLSSEDPQWSLSVPKSVVSLRAMRLTQATGVQCKYIAPNLRLQMSQQLQSAGEAGVFLHCKGSKHHLLLSELQWLPKHLEMQFRSSHGPEILACSSVIFSYDGAGRAQQGCWLLNLLQRVLISGNFPPSDLIFNCNYRTMQNAIYWAFFGCLVGAFCLER